MLNSKHGKLKEKSSYVRNELSLKKSESVIQDYRCHLSGVGRGKVYLTQNYIAFPPSTKIGYHHVIAIELRGSTIVVAEERKNHVLSGFILGAQKECYTLMKHLWQHPATLVEVAREQQQQQQQLQLQEEEEADHELVDTESSRRALMKAHEALTVGVDTLGELERQANVIDATSDALHRIDADMDASERHLRGIESMGGAFRNKLGRNTVNKGASVSLVGRSVLQWKPSSVEPTYLDILFKHSNDDLEPARLCLKETSFSILRAEGDQPLLKDAVFGYDALKLVRVRTRPFHLDLVFRDRERLRLMSSSLQRLVRLLTKCVPRLEVEFEAESLKFQYKEDALDRLLARDPQRETSTNLFTTLSPNAPKALVNAVAQQDRDLDEISSVSKDLKQVALTMGSELDRQIDQLEEVSHHVNKVDARVKAANERIEDLL